jgi:hypothetical protein
MAWKFRKRIKIIPGICLNISTKGISTTIGVRGASINLGPNGTYLNMGIPGTGLYNQQKISGGSKVKAPAVPEAIPLPTSTPQESPNHSPSPYDNIFSVDANEITSGDMQGIKDTILMAHQQRKELATDRFMVFEQWKRYERRLRMSYWLLYGFFFKEKTLALKADIAEQKRTLEAIDHQLKASAVELDFDFDAEMHSQYQKLVESFQKLCQMEKVWDITASHANDQFATRSSAAYNVMRRPVKFNLASLPEIKSKTQAMLWQNANGADLYFYPNFVVVWNNKNHFAIIGYNELNLSYHTSRFIEEEGVPKDAVVIDKTWAKVNKNGQPDRRFKDNYQIPIVAYGNIELSTHTGLNERYLFSSDAHTATFNREFLEYQISLLKLEYVPEVSVVE